MSDQKLDYKRGRLIPAFHLTKSLIERMKTETIEELITPIDKEGYLLPDIEPKNLMGIQSAQSGHLLERISEILILFGVSTFENNVNVFRGQVPLLTQIISLDQYLQLNNGINTGSSSGVIDIYLQDKNTKKYLYG